MEMCAACRAVQDGQSANEGHAALMSLGRRGYRGFGKSRAKGGEHYVCRLCGTEWRRENGMHPVIRKGGWKLPVPLLSSMISGVIHR